MPVIAWLLGVPLSIVIILMLFGVFYRIFYHPLTRLSRQPTQGWRSAWACATDAICLN